MKVQSYILFFIAVLCSSCANRVTPKGGAKDVLPPEFVSAEPHNLTTNFKSGEIKLNFNEYVQLVDLPNQLIISPLIEPKPVINVIKHSVIIKIPDSLKQNTTYTLNFGKAIADIHESNVLENFQYVFSTGSVLDSLTCAGVVKDGATLQPVKGMLVMLYAPAENPKTDSLIFKKKPVYFTKTDEQGYFNIKNISAGTYSIFALDDKNGNFICDGVDEAMAFNENRIQIPQQDSLILLSNLLQPAQIHLQKASRIDRSTAVLTFNYSVDSVQLRNTKTQTEWSGNSEWSELRDSLFLFLPDTISDSLNLIVKTRFAPEDTVAMQIHLSSSSELKTKANKFRTTLIQSPFNEGPTSDLKILSSHPIRKLNDVAIILEDSLKVNPADIHVIRENKNSRYFSVKYNWKEGKNYQVIIPSGNITDIYGITNDTLKYYFPVPTAEATASFSVKVWNCWEDAHYLLQLTNEKFAVCRQIPIKKENTYNFSFVPPGVYHIRVVKDDNGNGRWDGPDFSKQQQAEKVSVLQTTLQLRANWELDTEINCP